MATWTEEEAQQHFDEMLDLAEKGAMQTITRENGKSVYIVRYEDWLQRIGRGWTSPNIHAGKKAPAKGSSKPSRTGMKKRSSKTASSDQTGGSSGL